MITFKGIRCSVKRQSKQNRKEGYSIQIKENDPKHSMNYSKDDYLACYKFT